MPPVAQDPVRRVPFTVPAGTSTSSAGVDLLGHVIVAVITPSAFTSTTVSFDQWVVTDPAANPNDGTWVPVYDSDGSEVAITVAANRVTLVSPSTFPYAAKVRVRTGSAEAAERTLVLVTRALG